VRQVTVRCAGPAIFERPAAWGEAVSRRESGEETEFVLHDPARLDEVLAQLVQQRVRVHAVVPERATLEALFLETAETAGSSRATRSA